MSTSEKPVLDWAKYRNKPAIMAQCVCGHWYQTKVQTVAHVHYSEYGCPRCATNEVQTPPPEDYEDEPVTRIL